MALSGCGTAITFASGFLAEILDAGVGFMRNKIDTSHFGSTWETSIPSCIKRHKQLRVQIAHDPDQAVDTVLGAAAETVTITFPVPSGKTNGAKLACSGYMVDYEISIPFEDRIVADVAIQFTGAPTLTDAS